MKVGHRISNGGEDQGIATTSWTIQTRARVTNGTPTNPPSSTAITQPDQQHRIDQHPEQHQEDIDSAIDGG